MPALIVVNPAARGAAAVRGLMRRSPELFSASIETRPDAGNSERVAAAIARADPQVVVAAGGDGTVSAVAEGILTASRPVSPALAILPVGTANNVARSFGLRSIRSREGGAALALAVSVLLEGDERSIDLGRVDGRHFVNALAVGFDADVLSTRNRLRRRSGLARRIDGYPLYLWSAAVNVFHNHHGADARLCLDGTVRRGHAYNLLFTNTPLYGGGFRVDDNQAAEDGLLDLYVFEGPLDYLRRLPEAWARERQYAHGRIIAPSGDLYRVREASIELDAPVRCQIDGEEIGRRTLLKVGVLPGALRVRVPRAPAQGRS